VKVICDYDRTSEATGANNEHTPRRQELKSDFNFQHSSPHIFEALAAHTINTVAIHRQIKYIYIHTYLDPTMLSSIEIWS